MKKNTLFSVFSHSKKMVTLALAGALTLSLLFTGCGSSKSYAAGDSDYAPAENTKQSWASSPTAVQEEMAQDTAADDGAALTEAGPNQVLQNKNVKLIWFADVTMETLDFEPLIAGIEETVAQYQGYVESSSVSGGNRLTGGRDRHYADYTIRVPSQQLNGFLNQMGTLGNITYQNLRSENITLEYADNEARKMTLELEEKKLMELLEQATDLADIIQLESRLSEIHYQLDALSSTLRKYDDLVDYSTVYLTVNEVQKITETPLTLGQRISTGFSDSLYELKILGENLLVFLIARSPILLLVAVIAVLIVLLLKRLNKRNKEKIAQYNEQRQAAMKAQAENKNPNPDETK